MEDVYENVLTGFVCECGAFFETVEELEAHQSIYCNLNSTDEEWNAHDGCGPIYDYKKVSEKWVVDKEAWDETVTTTYCSVCGAVQ